jgi:carboxylate-amine ligase
MKPPKFTVGVEEEYLLVDRETRDLATDPPDSMIQECAQLCEGQVNPEFLRAQIEVGTPVNQTVAETRRDLAHLRRSVVEVADRYGLAPIAASTHPFASWHDQAHTPKARYHALANDLQAVADRLLICGMHVHVGIEDPELRIDLMNQLSYFLPHLLALSCSSPFWEGYDTGLKSYRLTVFDALPRTELPEHFESYSEYERHVNVLVKAGIIEDATKIWWDIRPSARYPTLETRVMDVCTYLDDTIAVTALLTCIIRMLYRLRTENQRWRLYARMLIDENRWRAMRYSFDQGLMDFGRGEIVPYKNLLEELIELVSIDARELGCEKEVHGAFDILRRGTSAHRQVETYQQAIAAGADEQEALRQVVDRLIEDTRQGIG